MVDIARLETAGKTGPELDQKRTLAAPASNSCTNSTDARPSRRRLAITYPEIAECSPGDSRSGVRLNKEGLKIVPEIMIPLAASWKELEDQKLIVTAWPPRCSKNRASRSSTWSA